MAGVVVELTGDEAKLLASMQKIIAQNAKTGESFKKTGEEAKKASDDAVKEQQRIERESKKAADSIYAAHQKMLDDKARESRQAALDEESLARKTAFAEVQAAIEAAEEEIKATEKILREKTKAAQKEKDLADRARDQEAKVSSARINGLIAAAGSYVSLNAVVSLYKQNLQEQIALQDQSLSKINEIAAAQSGAVKNLSGLSTVEKARAFEAAKALQTEIGFSSQASLTEAIGSGYSASGDLSKTMSAVRAASQLTRLTPTELPTVSAGALDVSRGTGISDAKVNLSFLLDAGALARIEDPAMLAKTLAPSISSGVATVPGQDKQEASKQIASIFSELNQFATDTQGESTRTATITLLSKLEEFFRGREGDSGTVLGRIEQIKNDQDLMAQFFKNDFGEAAFKGGFRQLFQDGPLLDKVRANTNVLNFDTRGYNQTVAELETVSPEIRAASEDVGIRAEIEQRANNAETATIASMRALTNDALVRYRRGGIASIVDITAQGLESLNDPGSASVQQSARFFVTGLQKQINRIDTTGGQSQEDISRKQELEKTIQIISDMAARNLDPQSTADRIKDLEAMDRNNKLLESIDQKLGGNSGSSNANAIRQQSQQPRAE